MIFDIEAFESASDSPAKLLQVRFKPTTVAEAFKANTLGLSYSFVREALVSFSRSQDRISARLALRLVGNLKIAYVGGEGQHGVFACSRCTLGASWLSDLTCSGCGRKLDSAVHRVISRKFGLGPAEQVFTEEGLDPLTASVVASEYFEVTKLLTEAIEVLAADLTGAISR